MPFLNYQCLVLKQKQRELISKNVDKEYFSYKKLCVKNTTHCCNAYVNTKNKMMHASSGWHKHCLQKSRFASLKKKTNNDIIENKVYFLSAFTTIQLHLMKLSLIVIIVSATL